MDKRLGIFARFKVFLQPNQIPFPGLSGGVNGFRKKSSVYTQLKSVTGRQTDVKAVTIAQHLP